MGKRKQNIEKMLFTIVIMGFFIGIAIIPVNAGFSSSLAKNVEKNQTIKIENQGETKHWKLAWVYGGYELGTFNEDFKIFRFHGNIKVTGVVSANGLRINDYTVPFGQNIELEMSYYIGPISTRFTGLVGFNGLAFGDVYLTEY